MKDLLITSDPEPEVVLTLGCFSCAELPGRVLCNVCESFDEFTESVGERSGGESGGDVGSGVASRGFETFVTGFKFSSEFRLSLLVAAGLSVTIKMSNTN